MKERRDRVLQLSYQLGEKRHHMVAQKSKDFLEGC